MSETELLLVTADEHLRAEVARLAAAAGVEPTLADTPVDGLRRWVTARVVLVGADLAAAVADLSPPRRERVHVVGTGADPPLREALACSAESVLSLPVDADRLVRMLTDAVDGARDRALTVGVVGGVGGAGATVFAAALAGACSALAPTVLIDADPLGAGVDQVLGLDPGDGIRWDALLQGSGRFGARALRESLPRRHDLAVLAWPRAATVVDVTAAREVLSAARRGFDVVVLDLARHPDPLGDELASRCDRAHLVTTRTVPAVMAAERIAARLPQERTSLVVRGSGGVEADQVGSHLGLPVAVAMADQRGLDEALSLGAGPLRRRRGPLARAARQVASLMLDQRL